MDHSSTAFKSHKLGFDFVLLGTSLWKTAGLVNPSGQTLIWLLRYLPTHKNTLLCVLPIIPKSAKYLTIHNLHPPYPSISRMEPTIHRFQGWPPSDVCWFVYHEITPMNTTVVREISTINPVATERELDGHPVASGHCYGQDQASSRDEPGAWAVYWDWVYHVIIYYMYLYNLLYIIHHIYTYIILYIYITI